MPTSAEREKAQWNEESFFNNVSQRNHDKADIIKKVYDYSKTSEIRWGTGKVNGSFSYVAEVEGRKITIFSVFSSGYMSINFGNMTYINQDKIMTLRNELNRIQGINLPEEAVTSGKYPSFDMNLLVNNESMSIFKSSVIGLVEPLRAEIRETDIKEKYDDNKFSGDINVSFKQNPSKDVTLTEDD